MILRKGHKGNKVKEAQKAINRILDLRIAVDGVFGSETERWIKVIQRQFHLIPDGIIGYDTWQILNAKEQNFMLDKTFVVFVDAGHGGIDQNGKYMTAGKRAFHKNKKLHDGKGNYYEGWENRIIAEKFIKLCSSYGIPCVRTYHPHEDTPLKDRVDIVQSYLDMGYRGYLHSFHSNAISSSNSEEKLEKTRGFIVFTTTKQNDSDLIAQTHFDNIKYEFPKWQMREQLKDGDSDHEANFYILRNLDKKYGLPAILEEFGFHTSRVDADFITKKSTRKKRANAALKTALWVKNNIQWQ